MEKSKLCEIIRPDKAQEVIKENAEKWKVVPWALETFKGVIDEMYKDGFAFVYIPDDDMLEAIIDAWRKGEPVSFGLSSEWLQKFKEKQAALAATVQDKLKGLVNTGEHQDAVSKDAGNAPGNPAQGNQSGSDPAGA